MKKPLSMPQPGLPFERVPKRRSTEIPLIRMPERINETGGVPDPSGHSPLLTHSVFAGSDDFDVDASLSDIHMRHRGTQDDTRAKELAI